MCMDKVLRAVSVMAVLSVLGACDDTNPVEPRNQLPVIRSLLVFPASIGPTDSAIVICDAVDPEGGALRYDWISDGRLRLRGAPDGETFVLASQSNTQVVTYGTPQVSDTAWVQCIVRDDSGHGVGALIRFPLNP